MEERLRYLPAKIETWLKQLLLSETAQFYLLHNIDKEILAPIFSIEIREYRGDRSPLEKRQGYLILDEKDKDVITKSIQQVALECILSNKFTGNGLTNYLLFVDRLGNIPDTMRYDMLVEFCHSIPNTDLIKVVSNLLELFNKEYKFSQSTTQKLSLNEWEDLFLHLDYLSPFDNPFSLLRTVINSSPSDIDLINITETLLPDPRVALFHYGIDLNSIQEIPLLKYLKENPDQTTFYATLIIHADTKPGFAGKELMQFLICDDWNTVGKYYFRKTYAGSRKQFRGELKQLIEQELSSFVLREISEDLISNNIIAEFEWPTDFVSFGGLIVQAEEQKIEMSFSKSTIENLALAFASICTNTEKNLSEFISNRKNSYHHWPQDPFDLKVQYSYSYIMWSIHIASDDTWKQVLANFKRLCHSLKALLYGSFSANRLGLEISDNLLCILFSFPKFTEDSIQNTRFEELLDLFINLVGIQWVHFTERNDLIWDYKNHKSGYPDMRLLYVLKRLQDTPQIYSALIEPFRSSIKSYSTIDWPIEKEKEKES